MPIKTISDPVEKPVTLLRMDNSVVNPTTALFAVAQIQKYFAEAKRNQPPLPNNVTSLAPFNVLITSLRDEKRLMQGTIKLLKPDGKVCYEATWQIDKA